MEMTLNLTFEDGLKVVNAMRNVAIDSGWEADELADSGVIEEYSRVVDAALSAMGINLSISNTPSDEEDEDFDEEDFDFDEDEYYDEEDDEDEEDEEDEEDTCEYTLTVKGDFVLRYMNAGHSFAEACKIADILFGEGEGE